jgi:hypothetical protein
MSLLIPQRISFDHGGYTTTAEEGEKLLIDRRIANYNLVLDFFTGVLAGSTIGLWIATQLILRHNRETAESQLRAYVAVEPKESESCTQRKRQFWPMSDSIILAEYLPRMCTFSLTPN